MRMPRFSIARLMGLVVVAACLSWLYRTVGGPNSAFVLFYAAMIVGQSLVYRYAFRERRVGSFWIFAASAAAIDVGFVASGVLFVGFGAMLCRFVAAVFLLPVPLGVGAAWAFEATRPDADRRRSSALAWSSIVVLVALPASTIVSDWPMRLAFLASRPALDRLADRIASGETLDRPEWAGLFRVAVVPGRGPAGHGNVVLVLEADSSRDTYFVRSASTSTPPAIPPQVFSNRDLGGDGRWWVQEED